MSENLPHSYLLVLAKDGRGLVKALTQLTCTDCDGRGTAGSSQLDCSTCNARGYIWREAKVKP